MKKLLFILSIAAFQFCNAQVTLVGMSHQGGFGNHGTIFCVSAAGTIETIHNFNEGLNGCTPRGGFVQDSNGNFYGLAAGCGIHNVGTLIKYNGEDHGVVKLVDFHSTIGANPVGTLIIGTDGNLYGMTNSGGANDVGTIFKCTTGGEVTTLASFDRSKGAYPMGSLVEDKNCNLYGMTRLGGNSDKGVLFKCSSSGELTVLHSFNGNDGSGPDGNLTILNDSILYGVTPNGGNVNGGTIFLCSVSGKYTMLNSFSNSTGTLPLSNLLNGGDGYLYGTTDSGGAMNYGTLFRCSTSGRITVLANFNDSTTGANPMGTIVKASDGNIYGITRRGGTSDAGVVFKYTGSSGTLGMVCEFSTTYAQVAQGGIIEMKLNNDLKELASSKKFNKHFANKRAAHAGMGE